MIRNKKAYTPNIFGFFFILMIISSIFFFGSFVIHYILYDYGLQQVSDTFDGNVLQTNGTAMQSINSLKESYLSLTGYYDILFLVLIVSAFIGSTVSAIKARESGFISFFGFVTIGNVFLIFIMFYGSQIQGWLLNEFIYSILLVTIDSPIITMFFNYGMYIGVIWYLWLLGVNQLDLNNIKSKYNTMFSREKMTSEDGRFEE